MPRSSFAFADDIKFVAKASEQYFGLAQRAVDVVGDWSITHLKPLIINKSLVLHCGLNNPKIQYVVCNYHLSTATQQTDLGVL